MSGIERQGDLMYQFNGMVEREEAFGLELYETPFRSYDAQLGRFWQTDPLADQLHGTSVFQFAFNNPISLNDPTGLIPKKDDIEYTYSFDQGSWLNSSGQQVSTSEAMAWVNGSFLWDNRDDVLTLSGDIMTKALSLMGEGEITNFAISEGRGRGEVARITYDHKAPNGQRSLVGISLETDNGDDDRNLPGHPIRDIVMPILKGGLKLIVDGIKSINDGDISGQVDFYHRDFKNDRGFGIDFEIPLDGARFTVINNMDMTRVKASLKDAITTFPRINPLVGSGEYIVSGIGISYSGVGFEWMGEYNKETQVITRKGSIRFLGGYIEHTGVDTAPGKSSWRIGWKYSGGMNIGVFGIKVNPINVGIGWEY